MPGGGNVNGILSSGRKRLIINLAAFLALMAATWFGLSTPWGLLFIYWTIPNFRAGRALLVFDVERKETPVLFWLVQLAWVVLGISMILIDFLPGGA